MPPARAARITTIAFINGSGVGSMSVAAIVVAGGHGARVGGEIPKQYLPLAGKPVLTRTLEAFLPHPAIARIQVVIRAEDRPLYESAVERLGPMPDGKLQAPVEGGATRQLSVLQGLEAFARSGPDRFGCVLVHDGARPFTGHSLIDRAVAAGLATGAAVPGLPVADTMKVVDRAGLVVDTPARDALRAIQTPQAFSFPRLLDAHRAAAAAGLSTFPDDGALAEWAGLAVTVFAGEPGNVKMTHMSDFEDAESRLLRSPALVTRIGSGFDVHAFGDGDHVWIGGVRIAHDRGVVAHSDGDVALHALTDALLGALADGDIGTHFPPSDERWRNAPSRDFLAFAARRARDGGGLIDHLDTTVLCEAPKIGPHRDAMRDAIASAAGISRGQVSIKATTTERLGFVGRREGLAAQAVATVRLPAVR